MNVAIFTEVLSPHISGISTYAQVLKKGLEGRGHKVLIVTSSVHTEQASVRSETSQRLSQGSIGHGDGPFHLSPPHHGMDGVVVQVGQLGQRAVQLSIILHFGGFSTLFKRETT